MSDDDEQASKATESADGEPRADGSMDEMLGAIRRLLAESDESDEGTAPEGASASTGGEGQGDELLLSTPATPAEPAPPVARVAPVAPVAVAPVASAESALPVAPVAVAPVAPAEPVAPATNPTPNPTHNPTPEEEPTMSADEPPRTQATPDAPSGEGLKAQARAAVAEPLRRLRDEAHRAREHTNPADGLSLEALARELMQPRLEAWLNENLPRIVDQVVREEVRRIARRIEEE